MPRLEGGTNQTSKIALIVVGVLIAAGVAWYALSAGQNGADTEGATPVPSASQSPEAGSPPSPPDAMTTALPEVTSAPNGEMGGDVMPTPNAMEGGAMSSETPMGGAMSSETPMGGAMSSETPMGGDGAMAAPTASADGAGVTMTPAGNSGAMSSDAPASR